MALIASSIEMSFSLSRLRRTLRSMSIGPPPCPRAGGRASRGGVLAAGLRRGPSELHLHLARAQFRVTELAMLAVVLHGDPAVTGDDHPALGVPGRALCVLGQPSSRLGGRRPW